MNNRISKYGVLRTQSACRSSVCWLPHTATVGARSINTQSQSTSACWLYSLRRRSMTVKLFGPSVSLSTVRCDALFFREEDLQIPLLKDSFAMELTPEQKQEFKALT